MRAIRILAGSVLAMGSILVYAACANDAEPQPAGPTPEEDGSLPLADAGVSDTGPQDSSVARDADADAAKPLLCSDAGWCETRFDAFEPTRITALYPLGATAFATDEGSGVIEYDGKAWHLVLAQPRLDAVWASGPDDVWAAGELGTIVHGTRKAGVWTWTHELVGTNQFDDFVSSLWGSGPDDIYLTTNNQWLYHRGATSDAGADAGDAGSSPWRIEYQDTQPATSQFRLWSVLGSGPDDVWVLGTRALTCGTILHKKQGVYSTVADCTIDCSSGACVQKPMTGIPLVDWAFTRSGFLPTPGTMISINTDAVVTADPPSVQRITLAATGPAQITRWPTPGLLGTVVWGPSATDLWVSSYGAVLHNPDAFTDAGAFRLSTVVLEGIPLITNLTVRGTSASDIWVFGGPYALHQSKP